MKFTSIPATLYRNAGKIVDTIFLKVIKEKRNGTTLGFAL